jgi:flagellar biosynthesis protein FlhA
MKLWKKNKPNLKGAKMKNYTNFSAVAMAIAFFVLFSNVAVVAYVLINTFMNYGFPNNYIFGIITFIVISSLHLFLNLAWKRISAVSVKFTLDSLPGKQMAIEAELSSENITNDEADNKKQELQKRLSSLTSIDGCAKLFSKISKTIFIGLMAIVIMLLIIKGLGIFVIDEGAIMTIIICGITSQLLFCLTAVYAGIFITKMK